MKYVLSARCAKAGFLASFLCASIVACTAQQTDGGNLNETVILTGADRRPAVSLDGEWASIVDPYFSGLFSFHHQEKPNGWFLNRKPQAGDPFPTEYDYSKAPKL